MRERLSMVIAAIVAMLGTGLVFGPCRPPPVVPPLANVSTQQIADVHR